MDERFFPVHSRARSFVVRDDYIRPPVGPKHLNPFRDAGTIHGY
ncbi:MAG: hypothetical protein OEM19_04465 [Deltaproteobacteria bacterium]|nr:hypothetical protein [Deltaproteobacteria bacterium]